MSRRIVGSALRKCATEDTQLANALTHVADLLISPDYLKTIPSYVYYDLDTLFSEEMMDFFRTRFPLMYKKIWPNPNQLCCFRLIAAQQAGESQ